MNQIYAMSTLNSFHAVYRHFLSDDVAIFDGCFYVVNLIYHLIRKNGDKTQDNKVWNN